MKRAVHVLYWVIPVCFCAALYWRGLAIWFVQDDFGWLGLRNQVTGWHGFLWAMFAPLAQGTIRPWSERGFFLLFSSLFGLHPLPFRAFVFLNQFINVLLVIFLTRRITQSAAAGFLAPLLWLANPALALPMAWTSAYNEIQCATFLMLSLSLFVRFTETEKRGYLWAQYVAFGLGFGSNELTVVYPAMAALYAFWFARRHLGTTAPLFMMSTVFAVGDRLIANPATGAYAMSFRPTAVWATFVRYLGTLFFGLTSGAVLGWPKWTGEALAAGMVAGVVAFAVWRTRKQDYAAAFGVCWFLIVLAPLLPLHNHVTSYYVMIPAIGAAMAGAYGIVRAWQNGLALAVCATVLAGTYFCLSSAESSREMAWHFERAERARELVQGVVEVKRRHPGKLVLIENVDEQLFWAAIYDLPFARIFGWRDVFLTPESRALIPEPAGRDPLDGYFFPESVIRAYVGNGSAVVCTFENGVLRNATAQYAALLTTKPAPLLDRSIDVGLPYEARQIGAGWFAEDNGARWSSQRAIVYLPGPVRPHQKLRIHGWVNRKALAEAPLRVALTVGGCQQPVKTIAKKSSEFTFEYDIPSQLVGQERIEVAVAVDRTARVPPDPRNLGLAFGQFSIR